MHPFRAAIEADDIDAAIELLAPDVLFRSPVVHSPYHGRAAVEPILRAAKRVFEDFSYVREIDAGNDVALVFAARIGDRGLEGCDFLTMNDAGQIAELTVMVRPLSATLALAEAMKAQLS